jgi:hypothetical protein
MIRLKDCRQETVRTFGVLAEIVCKKYVSASAETQVLEDEFSGTLTCSELGSLIVAELNAPLHFWSRKSRPCETMARKSLSSASFKRAREELTQFGRSAGVGPGDLVIYVGSRLAVRIRNERFQCFSDEQVI